MTDMQRICPTCGKLVPAAAENPSFPFCNERCKMLDLANWLDGNYRIAAQDEEIFSQNTDLAYRSSQDKDKLS